MTQEDKTQELVIVMELVTGKRIIGIIRDDSLEAGSELYYPRKFIVTENLAGDIEYDIEDLLVGSADDIIFVDSLSTVYYYYADEDLTNFFFEKIDKELEIAAVDDEDEFDDEFDDEEMPKPLLH